MIANNTVRAGGLVYFLLERKQAGAPALGKQGLTAPQNKPKTSRFIKYDNIFMIDPPPRETPLKAIGIKAAADEIMEKAKQVARKSRGELCTKGIISEKDW